MLRNICTCIVALAPLGSAEPLDSVAVDAARSSLKASIGSFQALLTQQLDIIDQMPLGRLSQLDALTKQLHAQVVASASDPQREAAKGADEEHVTKSHWHRSFGVHCSRDEHCALTQIGRIKDDYLYDWPPQNAQELVIMNANVEFLNGLASLTPEFRDLVAPIVSDLERFIALRHELYGFEITGQVELSKVAMVQMLAPVFHQPPANLIVQPADWRAYQEVVGRRLGFVLTTGSPGPAMPHNSKANGYVNTGVFKKGRVGEMSMLPESPLTNMTDETVLVTIMGRLLEAFPEDPLVREAVNIGAGIGAGRPGRSGSDSIDPMFPLFMHMNFSGMASEPLTTDELQESLPSHLHIKSEPTTPHNVLRQLREARIHETFGALKIDIDSYDCHVLEVIIRAGYQPLVIMMELQSTFPPPLKFARTFVNRREMWECTSMMNRDLYSLQMPQTFRSCSLSFANDLLSSHGYVLLGVMGFDGVWVHESVFYDHFGDTFPLLSEHVWYWRELRGNDHWIRYPEVGITELWEDLLDRGFIEHAERWAWDWLFRAATRCLSWNIVQHVELRQSQRQEHAEV